MEENVISERAVNLDKDWIDHVFSYHSPDRDQAQRYGEIRAKARELAHVILNNVPACGDRSAAFRKLREAVMTANAGIALAGRC